MSTFDAMDRRIERGRATRDHLLATATALFAERGYERTSLELVLERAGVSRGSLYHHFDGKAALFEAALESVEAGVAQATVAAAREIEDPLEALRAGCRAWLKLARDPTVQRIVLIDAPGVVGWRRWREIDERHAFGILKRAVAEARPPAPEIVAHVLLAALIEVAMLVARSDRPKAALRDGTRTVDALLDGLLRGGPEKMPGADGR